MGWPRRRRWNTCLMWFATSLGALCLTLSCIGAEVDDGVPEALNSDVPNPPKPACTPQDVDSTVVDRRLMLVSTLDGRLSALDVKDDGKLLWSVQADSRPLLSSSISKLEIMHDGIPTRYIPSLDGGLYRYDGESIEAVPMSAETLLSSSFKLADNTVMIGGKDLQSYGISPVTGQVRYACGVKGCHTFGEEVTPEEDLLVVTRNTQTVRAVDSRSGQENWNFSVGQHEVNYIQGRHQEITGQADGEEGEDATVVTCPDDDQDDMDMDEFSNSIKIVVPEGMVVGVNPDNMQAVTWQHKFKSPVSNAWLLYRGSLESVDMFDNHHIPALSSIEPDEQSINTPLLYVGMHHSQLYVQPSANMHDRVTETASRYNSGAGQVPAALQDLPRVAWKPYLNTAQFRTPLLQGGKKAIDNGAKSDQKLQDEEHGLMVWHEQYPFDNGYYLYPEHSVPVPPMGAEEEESRTGNQSTEFSMLDDLLPVSLWTWWKEVLAISIIMSVLVHITLTHLARTHGLIQVVDRQSSNSNSQTTTESSVESIETKSASRQNSDETKEYTSRYSTDFENIQILGKGGFGVVFESKNVVDDCHYAVKRIALPKSDGAKEKVMREVKALAKLDHVGIVRYFHAWLEAPPPGWQEARDQELGDSECMSVPTPCNSVSVEGTKSVLNKGQAQHGRSVLSALRNPFGGNNPFQVAELDLKRGGSEEFSIISESRLESSEDEESGSFSIGMGSPNLGNFINGDDEDDSVDIEFKASDSECEDSNMSNNRNRSALCPELSMSEADYSCVNIDSTASSVQVVFEDSGCGDKASRSNSGEKVVIGIQSSQSGDPFTSHDSASSRVTKSHSRSPSGDLAILTYEKEGKTDEKGRISEQKLSSTQNSVFPPAKLYLFIQMQLCKRETLKDWLSANTLNRDRHMVLDMFDQIVSAVEYVHDCGLMHRDLKPSNIFFSLDGVIKMGDFGLVTAMAEEQNEMMNSLDSEPHKKHTAQVGTTLYMSPEQMSGKVYSHKVDIFSLGIILFELMYPLATQMERVNTLVHVKQQKIPDRFIREMPKETQFVRWLLSANPDARPSARSILESELLKDFVNRRMPTRFRSRTISQNSN